MQPPTSDHGNVDDDDIDSGNVDGDNVVSNSHRALLDDLFSSTPADNAAATSLCPTPREPSEHPPFSMQRQSIGMFNDITVRLDTSLNFIRKPGTLPRKITKFSDKDDDVGRFVSDTQVAGRNAVDAFLLIATIVSYYRPIHSSPSMNFTMYVLPLRPYIPLTPRTGVICCQSCLGTFDTLKFFQSLNPVLTFRKDDNNTSSLTLTNDAVMHLVVFFIHGLVSAPGIDNSCHKYTKSIMFMPPWTLPPSTYRRPPCFHPLSIAISPRRSSKTIEEPNVNGDFDELELYRVHAPPVQEKTPREPEKSRLAILSIDELYIFSSTSSDPHSFDASPYMGSTDSICPPTTGTCKGTTPQTVIMLDNRPASPILILDNTDNDTVSDSFLIPPNNPSSPSLLDDLGNLLVRVQNDDNSASRPHFIPFDNLSSPSPTNDIVATRQGDE